MLPTVGGNRGILPRAPSVRGPPNSAELAQIEKYDKTGLQLAMIKYALKFASKQQRQKKKKKKNQADFKINKKVRQTLCLSSQPASHLCYSDTNFKCRSLKMLKLKNVKA